LSGRLSEHIGKVRRELVVIRAQLEAMIDYPQDEDVNVLRHEEVAERVERIGEQIRSWLSVYEEGRRRRDGVRVALVGRPNVGKSSLLNALLGEDRAIVHHQAGTTRDVVGEAVQWGGLLLRLSDTAGLRQGDGDVEQQGIQRSWREVERADLVLFVIDRSEALTDEDVSIYRRVQSKPHLVLLNKSDLPQSQSFCDSSLVARDSLTSDERQATRIQTSAKTGLGLDDLRQAIVEQVLPHGRSSDQLFIANLRHKACLDKTLEALAEVKKGAEAGAGLELLAADLMIAANHLGEITGEISHEEVLSEIFSRFCLGK
jgi:tRNA modification GTPase